MADVLPFTAIVDRGGAGVTVIRGVELLGLVVGVAVGGDVVDDGVVIDVEEVVVDVAGLDALVTLPDAVLCCGVVVLAGAVVTGGVVVGAVDNIGGGGVGATADVVLGSDIGGVAADVEVLVVAVATNLLVVTEAVGVGDRVAAGGGLGVVAAIVGDALAVTTVVGDAAAGGDGFVVVAGLAGAEEAVTVGVGLVIVGGLTARHPMR